MTLLQRARLAATTCLVAIGLGAVGVPLLHQRVHRHEAELEHRLEVVDEDQHHRHDHRHTRGHGDPHEAVATRQPAPHHHHHDGGDDSNPIEHGSGAPEHLGVALLVAEPALPLSPPRAATQPPPPLARAGCLARTLVRPNLTRGPPDPGAPNIVAAS